MKLAGVANDFVGPEVIYQEDNDIGAMRLVGQSVAWKDSDREKQTSSQGKSM